MLGLGVGDIRVIKKNKAMITFIILLVLVVTGIYLASSDDCYKCEGWGWVMITFFGGLLLIHSIPFCLASYEYETFIEKRNAFEATLENARENGNEYETAAIVKEVADWNVKLAVIKYNNSTLFLDQYIDDRIKYVKPIQ